MEPVVSAAVFCKPTPSIVVILMVNFVSGVCFVSYVEAVYIMNVWMFGWRLAVMGCLCSFCRNKCILS